jgi:hypothetical protein
MEKSLTPASTVFFFRGVLFSGVLGFPALEFAGAVEFAVAAASADGTPAQTSATAMANRISFMPLSFPLFDSTPGMGFHSSGNLAGGGEAYLYWFERVDIQ